VKPSIPSKDALKHRMFQSFTGSSRRPRQVNLSGRNPNPFATASSSRPSFASPVAQNTLAVAQQERLARQQERDRLNAARRLQRTWRGYKSRMETHQIWREDWDLLERGRLGRPLDFRDASEGDRIPAPPYLSQTDCWMQLKLLLQFADPRNGSDILRLLFVSSALQKTLDSLGAVNDGWNLPLLRLGDLALRILSIRQSLPLSRQVSTDLINLLSFLSRKIPDKMRQFSSRFYKLLAEITTDQNLGSAGTASVRPYLIECVLALLQPLNNQTPNAYRDFAMEYLTTPRILESLGNVEDLAAGLNYKLLFKSIVPLLRDIPSLNIPSLVDGERRLWLLASLIYFHRRAHGTYDTKYFSEPDFIEVVSILLSTVAEEVAQRIDILEDVHNGDPDAMPSRRHSPKSLPNFVRREMLTLLDQNSIKGLLAGMTATPKIGAALDFSSSALNDAKVLASYVLTLLRVFRRRGNDIRLWLFLGSTSNTNNKPNVAITAVKYFWSATETTNVFHGIVRDHRAALDFLKTSRSEGNVPLLSLNEESSIASQNWRVILIFLELYTYVLQVMDDEEFLSGGDTPSSLGVDSTNALRQSALPLKDVQRLTLFLKNLAFSLYWNGSSIVESDAAEEDDSIRSYFSLTKPSLPAPSPLPVERKTNAEEFAEFVGVSLEYLKGLVTGVLRMIYERE
jgi:ubiquitin-protein ligase E3 C